jgi:hypothetical protein
MGKKITDDSGRKDTAEIEESIQRLLKKNKPEDKKENEDILPEEREEIIDADLESILGIKELLERESAIDAEYMRILMADHEIPDYSKIFDYHKGKAYEPYHLYSAYESEHERECEEDSYDMISQESVDKIIKDAVVKKMFSMHSENVTLEEKEAFEIYKIFNKTLIELKYETCLT